MDVTLRAKVEQALNDANTQLVPGRPLTAEVSKALGDPKTLATIAKAATAEALHLNVRSHLEQAVRLDPAQLRPRLVLFFLELAEQRFTHAEEIVTALIRENPQEPDYLTMYADLLLRKVELPKSKELTSQALRIEPKHAEATRIKAILELISGELPESGPNITRLLERDPQSQQVLLNLFHTLIERHQLPEAVRLGQELQRLQPDDEALNNALIDARIFAHVLGLPLYPLHKAGWLVSAAVWLASIAGYKILVDINYPLALSFAAIVVCFVVYSWVYPTLMRSWLRTRG